MIGWFIKLKWERFPNYIKVFFHPQVLKKNLYYIARLNTMPD